MNKLMFQEENLKNVLVGMGLMPIVTHASPAGRLAHFVSNWEVITKDQWVLQTVRGYNIEFHTKPLQAHKPHPPKFNQEQDQLMKQEVETLLTKGAIEEVESTPAESFHSTLFLVPKRDGGQRPVINLKALNAFIEAPHFKMEGIHTLKNLLKQGDWLVKVDLKDAYFSIPIALEHRKYLSFTVGRKTYQFTCLPFGLTSAPWVFTKTLKPVAALGRQLVIIYLDDILLMGESKEQAQERVAALIYLLQCLGFVINTEKTITDPTQKLEFLGFMVNTMTMELSLPSEKLKKIRAESRKLLGAGQVSARALSRLIGKMSAANQVIPPAPLFYRWTCPQP